MGKRCRPRCPDDESSTDRAPKGALPDWVESARSYSETERWTAGGWSFPAVDLRPSVGPERVAALKTKVSIGVGGAVDPSSSIANRQPSARQDRRNLPDDPRRWKTIQPDRNQIPNRPCRAQWDGFASRDQYSGTCATILLLEASLGLLPASRKSSGRLCEAWPVVSSVWKAPGRYEYFQARQGDEPSSRCKATRSTDPAPCLRRGGRATPRDESA